jgi:putative oxidoreductase
MYFAVVIEFLARLSLVLLFLPFSALDKILNFRLATQQARQAAAGAGLAKVLIVAGFLTEVFMSLGVLTGIADRFAAFMLAGYCAVTALVWKPFWRQSDFRLRGKSAGRDVFWDFLKNFAVAGGFLMITFGPTAGSAMRFIHSPFSSSHPYAVHRSGEP